MRKILRAVSRLTPVVRSFWGIATGELRLSYSQFGEDAMLKGFMEKRLSDPRYKGFWVDVGAHHPNRFSNTKMYYDCGWRGINVDAMSDAIKLFNMERSRDINVNVGIAEHSGLLTYYMFEDYAENTFSKEYAEIVMGRGTKCFGVSKVMVITMKELLARYLPPGQHIDFFSIDAEGLDFAVLKSNDWSLYRPDYILVEIHTGGRNEHVLGSELALFLKDQGYVFAAQGFCTTIFKRLH